MDAAHHEEQAEVFGYEQAALITGIKKNTLYALVHARRIPHLRLGRRLVRFERGALIAWSRLKLIA